MKRKYIEGYKKQLNISMLAKGESMLEVDCFFTLWKGAYIYRLTLLQCEMFLLLKGYTHDECIAIFRNGLKGEDLFKVFK